MAFMMVFSYDSRPIQTLVNQIKNMGLLDGQFDAKRKYLLKLLMKLKYKE